MYLPGARILQNSIVDVIIRREPTFYSNLEIAGSTNVRSVSVCMDKLTVGRFSVLRPTASSLSVPETTAAPAVKTIRVEWKTARPPRLLPSHNHVTWYQKTRATARSHLTINFSTTRSRLDVKPVIVRFHFAIA